MAFLNPTLLFGLSAVSIPIIIHLLNRRQFRPLEWAAMRFLIAAIEQNRRRLQLEDLLLLTVRCLLVALVALALARPALRSATFSLFGRAGVTAVLVLDASASMQGTDGVQTAFDRAREAAGEFVDSLPAGSSVAIWAATDAVAPLIPEPTFDLELARRVLREARPTDRAGDLLPAVGRALESLQARSGPGRELVIVTDGQAAAWERLDAIRGLLGAPAAREIRTRVVLVGGAGEDNLAITDVRLPAGFARAGRPLRFEVDVTNRGRREARDARVTLAADPDPPVDEGTVDRIPAGETRTLSLLARLREPGFRTVTARLAGDARPSDDRRTLAVRVVDAVPVLLVDGAAEAGGRGGATFFLRHALQPAGAAGAEASPFRLTVVPAARLGEAPLDGFDVVALADVPDVAPEATAALQRWVEAGGGLVVFPGPRTDAAFYNETLSARHGLLPARLGEARGDAEKRDAFASLQERGHAHPVAALWNDPAAGSLAGARFYRWFPLEAEAVGGTSRLRPDDPSGGTSAGPPGPDRAGTAGGGHPVTTTAAAGRDREVPPTSGAPPTSIVLRYADGAPAVVEREVGRGRAILFGSTADTEWNDLPARPAFVPLAHRAFGRAAARRADALNVRAGRAFAWRAGPERINQTVAFTVPGAEGPVRHSRGVETAGGEAVVRYEATDLAGPGEASVGGEPPLVLRFAVQPDPAESSVDRLSPGRQRDLEEVARVTAWEAGGAFREELARGRVGVELWLPLAALALALGALETWLAHSFTRPQR